MDGSFRDGLESEAVGEGILDKLSLRKGVRKLFRHPLFQPSKSVKEKCECWNCKYHWWWRSLGMN